MFDDVGASAGRGVGGRVTCPRPLSWRYPTGFAGVCFAIVLGLGVWWSERCLLVVAVWPWWVSMGWTMCVFEGVGGCAGRRLGRQGRLVACWWTTFACSWVWPRLVVVVWVVEVVWVGRWWARFVVLGWAFRVFEVVGEGGGRRLGRLVACVWSPLVLVRRASVV